MQDHESFVEFVKTRRSVRKFKPDPIPAEHVTQMIEAARMAPTANNRQPWKFLVIQDPARIKALEQKSFALRLEERTAHRELTPEELEELRQALAAYYKDLFAAPLYIVVLTDSQEQYAHYNVHDGALAAGYLCLAALSLGYGTVYMTESIYETATREICRIPDRYERVCVVPIGIPDDQKKPAPKKALHDLVVYEAFE